MQNREPPAFQEYAAAMLAKIEFRTMTLAEQGLLYVMRLECWVNERLPADPSRLAKVLGRSDEEVSSAIPAVLPFFLKMDGFYSCPELDSYKLHLQTSRKLMSEGGKKSAAKRAGKTS